MRKGRRARGDKADPGKSEDNRHEQFYIAVFLNTDCGHSEPAGLGAPKQPRTRKTKQNTKNEQNAKNQTKIKKHLKKHNRDVIINRKVITSAQKIRRN